MPIPPPPKPALPPGITIDLYRAAKAAVFGKSKKKKSYTRSKKYRKKYK
jgi:hypothetical protein